MLLIHLFALQISSAILTNNTDIMHNCNPGSNCLECMKNDNHFCISCKPGYGIQKNIDGKSNVTCGRCIQNFCAECSVDNQ